MRGLLQGALAAAATFGLAVSCTSGGGGQEGSVDADAGSGSMSNVDAGSDAASEAGTSRPVDAGGDALVTDVGSECNTVANPAAVVTTLAVDAGLPAFTGGPIQPGTYFLTKYTVLLDQWTGSTKNIQQTLVVSPTTFERVSSTNGGPNVHASYSYASQPSSGSISVTGKCNLTEYFSPDEYTASGDKLLLNESAVVFEFTKQP
jgi:hypothetical protein